MLARPGFHHKRAPTYKSLQDLIAGLGGVSGAGRVVYTDTLGNLKTESDFAYNDILNILSVAGDIRAGPGTFVGGIAQYYTDANLGTVITGKAGVTYDLFLACRDGGAALRVPANTRDLYLGNDKVFINNVSGSMTLTGSGYHTAVGFNHLFGSGSRDALRIAHNAIIGNGIEIASTDFTGSTSFEPFTLIGDSLTAISQTGKIIVSSGSSIEFHTGGLLRFGVQATGHFVAGLDNTYDIGVSNAFRPRDVYVANSLRIGPNLATAHALQVNAPSSAMLYSSNAGLSSTTTTTWIRSPKNTVTCFIGDTDSTVGYVADDFSGGIRFNGSGVAWGDFGYYPNGGDAGHFRFHRTGTNFGGANPNANIGASRVIVGDGTQAAPAHTFLSELTTGLYRYAAGALAISVGNQQSFGVSGGAAVLPANSYFGWGTGADAFVGQDVKLYRDAANVLAQRNGTSSQVFRLYNTFTDASNYERLKIEWSGNAALIQTEQTGTGTARDLVLGTTGITPSGILFRTNALNRWQIDSNGHFIASSDNTYDIGQSGGNRPRSGYFGTSLNTPLLTLGALAADSTVLRITSPGTSNNYVNFAEVNIGGQTGDLAFLRWTRGGSHDRWLSIFTATSAAASVESLTIRDASITARTPLLFSADNTHDIGAAGATRPRTGYFGTSLVLGTNPAATGSIRLQNNMAVVWRNAANTGDIIGMQLDVSDQLLLRGGNYLINSGGVFLGSADNTRDLGSSSVKFRDGYFGTSVRTPWVVAAVDQLALFSQTTNPIVFATNFGAAVTQLQVLHTASATRSVTITGSNGGNPKISVSAGDLELTPNVAVGGNLSIAGNTFIGNASTDTLNIRPNAITWDNAPTHSNNHIFSGNLTVNGTTTLGDSTTDVATSKGRHDSGMGTSSSVMVLAGKANVNTTPVANVGTGEDDLITYSLPANALSSAGKGVRITAWGINANNANAKTLKLYFGTIAILTFSLGVNTAGFWRVDALVFSTGTDAQRYQARGLNTTNLATAGNSGTLTQDDGAAITIKCTGTATSNNDITQEGLLVEFFN